MLQGFVNRVVFGFDTQHAVESPRFATYDFPSLLEPHERQHLVLKLESRLDTAIGADLAARGHNVGPSPDKVWTAGSLSLIEFDRQKGRMAAGSDPRCEVYAIGW